MVYPGFPVPDDIVPSGVGLRDWINVTFYGETISEVAKKKQDYFERYDPRGYDTRTVDSSIRRHPDGYYYIRIKRWYTCD